MRIGCKSREIEAACRKPSCVYPGICPNLNTDHGPLVRLYRRARALRGVKKILIGSGLRYDLAVKSPEYVKELVTHHVGGYLKIAPEHTEGGPLSKMMKPGIGSYDRFKQMFDQYSAEAGKKQYLIPYFIAAHPGTSDEDMMNLALWLKRNGFKADQVQTFYPSPMATATAMYHTDLNPLKGISRVEGRAERVDVVRGERRRRLHKAFLRWHDPNNWPLLRDALRQLGRADLIGNGKHQLIPTYQPATDGGYTSARRKNSTPPRPARGTVLTQHTGLPPRAGIAAAPAKADKPKQSACRAQTGNTLRQETGRCCVIRAPSTETRSPAHASSPCLALAAASTVLLAACATTPPTGPMSFFNHQRGQRQGCRPGRPGGCRRALPEATPAAREQLQQLDLGRVGVLELVDEHERAVGPLPGQHGGGAAPELHHRPDQLRGVVGAGVAQRGDPGVLAQEPGRGDPVRAAVRPAQGGQLARAGAPLDRPHEQVPQLLGEPPGAQGRGQCRRPAPAEVRQVTGQQLAHDDVLLGPGEQPRWWLAGQRGLAPQHPERVRMERAGQRLHARPAQPGADPVAHLSGGPAPEREHQHPFRVHPAVDPVHHGLDQSRGLAGAGTGQDEQRTAGVPDDGLLRRVEQGRHRRPRGGADQPVRRGGTGCGRHAGHGTTGVRQPWPSHRALAMSTDPFGRRGVPSRSSRAPASAASAGGWLPSARSTRHHGTAAPHWASTCPTWRGPPAPSSSATSP